MNMLSGRRSLSPILALVASGAFAFQVLHFADHIGQIVFWALHPLEPLWLSSWAAAGVDALAAATDGRQGRGSELLHLLGLIDGAAMAALLVLFHFTINLAATACAALAAPEVLGPRSMRVPGRVLPSAG